jgi:hypothetical protein
MIIRDLINNIRPFDGVSQYSAYSRKSIFQNNEYGIRVLRVSCSEKTQIYEDHN